MINNIYNYFIDDLNSKYNNWATNKVKLTFLLSCIGVIFFALIILIARNKLPLCLLAIEIIIIGILVYLFSLIRRNYYLSEHNISISQGNWSKLVREAKKKDFIKYMKDQNISFDSLNYIIDFYEKKVKKLSQNSYIKKGIIGILLYPIWLNFVDMVVKMKEIKEPNDIRNAVLALLVMFFTALFYYIMFNLFFDKDNYYFTKQAKMKYFINILSEVYTEHKMKK